MKVFKVICALFILGFVSVSHASVIFITVKDDNGQVISLLGADNVKVNDAFYDVRFVDGTCFAVFNDCDGADDFMFSTFTAARAASQALLDQVFVDVADFGWFDAIPALTDGCTGAVRCIIRTPYSTVDYRDGTNGFLAASGVNHKNDSKDLVGSVEITGGYNRFEDFGIRFDSLAVWSKVVEASAPSTAIMMLMSISGLLRFRRTKQS